MEYRLTIEQFEYCYKEALNYTDINAYISDLALSSIFITDWETMQAIPAEELINPLKKIWKVAHMKIKEIRKSTKLSQKEFCAKFLIPIRTMQDWEAEKRKCPEHEKLLLANACGLIELGDE